jgi:hypothetical protein
MVTCRFGSRADPIAAPRRRHRISHTHLNRREFYAPPIRESTGRTKWDRVQLSGGTLDQPGRIQSEPTPREGVIRRVIVTRLRARLALLVVVGVVFAAFRQVPASAACPLCVGTAKIVCPTCDGKKSLTADCWLCDGKGKRQCPVCSGGNDFVANWNGVTPGKGILPCPSKSCDKGVVFWADFGQKDKCRLCSGRSAIDCDFCLKTDFPCVPCGGRKKLQSACFDCRASGAVPCPLCATKSDAAPCALCAGVAGPDCAQCGASGRMSATCFACRGTDRAPCFECRGTGRQACAGCYGTGTMRYKLVNKTTGSETNGGKKSHDPCKGKGTIDCPDCQDRKAPCWMARNRENGHEKGKYKIECEFCYGKGKIECGGCSRGSHRGLEIAAGVLRGAGKPEEATAFLREALKRAERYFDSKRSANESADDIEKRVAAREAAMARIRKEIQRIDDVAAGKPGGGG